MCKVSKTGAGACTHVGRGSKDVSTQVTQEVKLLVMGLLLVGMSTGYHWRLQDTKKNIFEKSTCMCWLLCKLTCVSRKTKKGKKKKKMDRESACLSIYIMCFHANLSTSEER